MLKRETNVNLPHLSGEVPPVGLGNWSAFMENYLPACSSELPGT